MCGCRAVLTYGHAGQLPGGPMSIGAHANLRSPICRRSHWSNCLNFKNSLRTLVTSPAFVVTRMLHFLTVMAACDYFNKFSESRWSGYEIGCGRLLRTTKEGDIASIYHFSVVGRTN